jgi:kynurenine formamidase
LDGHAVLARTDHSRHFGTDAYLTGHPHLTAAAAEALAADGVACVDIDSLNIDGTSDGHRAVHTILLRAGIPIIEHLAHFDELPAAGFGFTFSAVPPEPRGAVLTLDCLAMGFAQRTPAAGLALGLP